MKLAVIGTGYVGLVTGAGFADMGNDVICADIDENKIAALKAGRIPIHEPGLDNIVAYNVSEERLSFTTNIAAAVQDAEVVFIAVGTPPGEDGSADLSHVLAAAAAVGQAIRSYTVVVNKSTVPVGTAEKVRKAIAAATKVPFTVASNPEFLKEGDAINDFMKPERIVIGCDEPRARDVLKRLYEPFTRTSDRIIYMDTASAELTKYASNAMLAVRISFMNDIARLCDSLGADVELVRKGMGSDSRIGPKFLFPGTGYGGSCFPKDVKALMATAREVGHGLDILESVHRVNERQKQILVDKLLAHFGSAAALKGRKVAIWGLAFKPRGRPARAPAVRRQDRAGRSALRRRAGRRRAGAGDRVAPVPAAQLRPHQGAAQGAAAVRRPQRVGPGHGPQPRLHLLRHREAVAQAGCARNHSTKRVMPSSMGTWGA
jgi:UDPglucose 6-dehydrogenase